jgi:5'(3')-deoxyribonucleotidase
MKRVLLDCDGVLSDFMSHLFTYLEIERFPYDEWGVLGKHPLLPWDKCTAAACTKNFCASMPEYPGARTFMETLRDTYDTYVVTSPWNGSSHWHHERVEWLTERGIDEKRIIFSSAKHICQGDVLIDDRFDNVLAWADAWPEGVGIVVGELDSDRRLLPNMRRATTYVQILDILEKGQ